MWSRRLHVGMIIVIVEITFFSYISLFYWFLVPFCLPNFDLCILALHVQLVVSNLLSNFISMVSISSLLSFSGTAQFYLIVVENTYDNQLSFLRCLSNLIYNFSLPGGEDLPVWNHAKSFNGFIHAAAIYLYYLYVVSVHKFYVFGTTTYFFVTIPLTMFCYNHVIPIFHLISVLEFLTSYRFSCFTICKAVTESCKHIRH